MEKSTENNIKPKKSDNRESKKPVMHPNNIVFYADSSEVNRIDSKDDYDYVNISENEKKRQSMDGFNDEYNNIVDYIVKITRQIWKEKDIGLIYDTYSTGIAVHKGLINSHGINEVISGTLQTLHAFPDRKGLGWSVIWSGNDKDGFFTSHRGRSVATNTGDSLYGPATGKKVMFRTTADCLIHANKIYEEWLVMDTFHLVQQLGLDPIEVAKKVGKSTKKLAPSLKFGYPETAETGLPPKLYVPTSEEFEIGDFILEAFNKIWERRSFNYVKEFYEENAVVHYVCNKDLVGHSEIQGMFISLFASVPNAKVVIERITCNKGESDQEWDVAVRWRIQGMHEGTGYFGQPSGKAIDIFGINHFKVKNGKIKEEWLLFDGIEVLRQIHLSTDDEETLSDGTQQADDGNFTGVS
ncbi:putative ester cyclase [Scopulibacillus darangshiensis]|uniref:Putative ester cyclase n=1 Tax=Scopulibacillus darangshiensis TaxID=442528 RepID=A0A4R2P7R6_9BACL|nr:ester cyclase [Scopulibacillus darangshiensis]TCP30943.1 putative ester cyclase [Scopulibacillus darangshiensis]